MSDSNFEQVPRSYSDEDLRDKFTYHAPTPEGVSRHARLSDLFTALATEVDGILPAGRDKSLVITKLEEAKFFASAAVARNPVTR